MAAEQNELREALQAQLTNIYNYPQAARAALWGADLSSVIDGTEHVAKRFIAQAWDEGGEAEADAEFKESLRAAREEAWEEGLIAGVSHFGQMSAPPNPYADRKMTPAEIEEWRKTCPYPDALGK